MEQAVRDVLAGQAQRICAPGQWKVWREGSNVLHEMLSNSPEDLAFAEYVKKASRAND